MKLHFCGRFGLLTLTLLLLGNDGLYAEALPGWASAALAKGVPSDWVNRPAVRLFEFAQVRFLGGERVAVTRQTVTKIGSEGGRSAANFTVPYLPGNGRVVKAVAWVVSADGRKAQRYTQERFTDRALDVGGVEWSLQRLLEFNASGVIEVGGALVTEVVTEEVIPGGVIGEEFVADIPVEWSLMEVVPAPQGRLDWRARRVGAEFAPAPASTEGSLQWSLRHRDTDSLPGGIEGAMRARTFVAVRHVHAQSGADDFSSWEKISAALAGLMGPQAAPTPAITAKARELTAGETTRWGRVAALCRFVQQEIRYLAISIDTHRLAGCRPHPAEEVLVNRYGDCKDKQTLLVAMLQAIGERGYGVLVSSGEPLVVMQDWPALMFNHIIVGIPADEQTPAHWPVVDAGELGRLVMFDPTNPVVPLGLLAEEDQGGHGLPVVDGGSALIRLPLSPAETNGRTRTIEAVVSPEGDLSARIVTNHQGVRGARNYWRRLSDRTSFEEAYATGLRRAAAGLKLTRWSDAWDKDAATFRIESEIGIGGFARKVGEQGRRVAAFVLRPEFADAALPAGVDGVFLFAEHREEIARIQVPPGWSTPELPVDWSAGDEAGKAVLTYRRENDTLVSTVRWETGGGYLNRAAFEGRRKFLLKVEEMVRRPVFLRVP